MMILIIGLMIISVVLFLTFTTLIAEESCDYIIINEQEEIIREYEELIMKLEEGDKR